MAEVVGTLASVAQLATLSGQLLAGGYGFLSKVHRAPSEIRSLLVEVAAIDSLLGKLQDVTAPWQTRAPDDALQNLERLGVFDECRSTLRSVQNALIKCEQLHGKDVGNFGRRLIWPFKEKETKESLKKLHDLRGLLATALEVNSASALRRIEASQDVLMHNVGVLATNATAQMTRQETETVISWLCPPPSIGAHMSLENALHRRLSGTGTWFLESETFKDWLKTTEGCLWITGLPGSGKTILCASVIEHIQQLSKSPRTALLYFFFDHRDAAKRTSLHFLMNITKQILGLSPACMHKAKEKYEEKGKNDRALNGSDYLSLIVSSLSNFDELYLVVDALDEASEEDDLADQFAQIRDACKQEEVHVRMMLSSRFNVLLERKYSMLASSRLALAENVQGDIGQYVSHELDTRVRKRLIKIRNKGLSALIIDCVTARAGTLLQARLQLDYLSTAKTDRDIKSMLQTLPSGLDSIYDSLLCSMASRYPTRTEEMKTLLQCLIAANSPLTASQLSEIMALQPGERFLDFDAVNTDPFDTLEMIAPLVVVDKDEKSNATVKLSHYSVDEYIRSERIRQGPAAYFYISEEHAHARLASVCLQYLTFSAFDTPLDQSPDNQIIEEDGDYNFLLYAAMNWFNHMRDAQSVENMRYYEPFLSWFVNGGHGSPCYNRWQKVMCAAFPYSEDAFHAPICFAISANLDELFDYLLPMLPNIDYVFADGFTCLTVAASWNRISVVKKLLDLGATVDLPTSCRLSTPLHLAAEFANEEVFDLLVEAGANPHARSRKGTTPFYQACRGGSVHIVRRLKHVGSDINARASHNWCPLMEAIVQGHTEVVRLLRDWDADLTVVSHKGSTAFDLASASHSRVMKRLIADYIDPGRVSLEECRSDNKEG